MSCSRCAGLWPLGSSTAFTSARHAPLFSMARRGRGSKPLRSTDQPLGLPNLSDADAQKVKLGNQFLAATISLASCAIKHRIPGSIENPHSSRLWAMPSMAPFLRQSYVRQIWFVCGFSASWRKRTRVAHWLCDLQPIQRQCASKKGVCSFTGHKHVILEGVDPLSKRFRTAIAEPYPRLLCKQWCACFMNVFTSRSWFKMSNVMR